MKMEIFFESLIFEKREKKDSLEEIETPLFFLALAISVCLMVFDFFALGIWLFLIVLGCANLYVWIFLWNKEKKNLGSFPYRFCVSNESIKIGNEVFLITEISDLRIRGFDYKGRIEYFSIFFGVRYPSKSMGVENSIQFNHNKKTHIFHFLIKSKKEQIRVSEIFENKLGITTNNKA